MKSFEKMIDVRERIINHFDESPLSALYFNTLMGS